MTLVIRYLGTIGLAGYQCEWRCNCSLMPCTAASSKSLFMYEQSLLNDDVAIIFCNQC